MSQRLRSCSKTTNFETINCKAYLNSLAKEKPWKQVCPQKCDCPRSRSLSNSKSKASLLLLPQTPTNLRSTPESNKQRNLLAAQSQDKGGSAVIEVTVRGNKTVRNASKNERQPWSDLLKSPQDVSSFRGTGPLRNLHLLCQDLNTALKTPHKIDAVSMSKIVSEMLETLSRIPHNVAHTIEQNTSKKSGIPEKRFNVIRSPLQEHKVCQTIIDSTSFIKNETVQAQLEESMKDLDKKCLEMEKLYINLQTEKQKLERLLVSEKDTVKFLRNQMEDLETERVAVESSTLSRLKNENSTLQSQTKLLKHQFDSQASLIKDYKNQAETLHKQQKATEEENINLHHNLAVSKLENEKYLAILLARDRQIKEILVEMNQLQEVVSDQLIGFQKKPLTSQASSQSTGLENWQQLSNEIQLNCAQEMGDATGFRSTGFSNENESYFEIPTYD